MKTWKDLGYELILSQDQSPTLRPWPAGQSMHHLGGALAESIFIYDRAAAVFLEKSDPTQQNFRALIVGLGLGYIELLLLKRLLLLGVPQEKIHLQSHEAQPELVSSLQKFFSAGLRPPQDEIETTYHQIFLQICTTGLQGDRLGAADQKNLAQNLFRFATFLLETKHWTLEGSLKEEDLIPLNNPFHVICFDAYSEKASPDLWTENFLQALLQNWCASECVFSTYACTGKLKRILQQAGFQSLRTAGFQGKRNSTLMQRG